MRRAGLLLVAWVAMTVAGCAKGDPPPSSSLPPELDVKDMAPLRNRGALPARITPTLLTRGALPLVHIFDGGGDIRVVDGETKQTLARAAAQPGALIAIDSAGGVKVSGQVILPGPLPRGRQYEIWWDPAHP